MNRLGRTDLEISELCLGSMTWGTQNSEAEGHAQIDRALERGVNFIDTAEMYPTTPISAETTGRTEEIIGTWVAANRARRDQVVLATKITGKGQKSVRDGAPISAATIREAIEGSLRRLQSDVIDLYQLHWPNRGSYMFRQNWRYDPSRQDSAQVFDHMNEVLDEMQAQVRAGRVRHFGLSNETAWGLGQWLRLAGEGDRPRPVSVQNEYSLLCRLYDTDLAELSTHEDVGLLAFSPLGAGYLTGKYADGAVPEGSRKSIRDDMGGREGERVHEAVAAYLEVARRHGVDMVQMALAWAARRPFTASAIFGATSMEQLDLALGAAELELSEELCRDLDAVHKQHPMPY
ncbi:aldo/keto reductase [Brevirhabdus pacifica]